MLIYSSSSDSSEEEPVELNLSVISNSCLVAAVQAGNVDTVKLLLKNGANVNAPLVYKEFVLTGAKEVCGNVI